VCVVEVLSKNDFFAFDTTMYTCQQQNLQIWTKSPVQGMIKLFSWPPNSDLIVQVQNRLFAFLVGGKIN
jgi:hypothetical protein